MGKDLIDNPQLHRPYSKELRSQLEDDLAHHIHNAFSLSNFKPILHVFKPFRLRNSWTYFFGKQFGEIFLSMGMVVYLKISSSVYMCVHSVHI